MGLFWSDSAIPGVHIGSSFRASDARGDFVKIWTEKSGPSPLQVDEIFYSVSLCGTVRGMHAQKDEAAGHRLVYVTRGAARDFVIDLRRGSPTYGHVVETHLEPGRASVLVPPGCAHGFESLEDDTTMIYIQQGGYVPDLDIGVHWTSCGFTPRASVLLVSERDDKLPHISSFDSPFVWSREQ